MAAARAQPGKMTVGSATTGYKLFIAAIHEAQKVSAVDVPYKSSALLMQDLVGGQMDYSVLEVSAVAPMVQAGRIRALVVVAPVRVQALPDVPTLAEAGVRGVSLMSWTALFAPQEPLRPSSTSSRAVGRRFAAARAHYAARHSYPGSRRTGEPSSTIANSGNTGGPGGHAGAVVRRYTTRRADRFCRRHRRGPAACIWAIAGTAIAPVSGAPHQLTR
jgi:hypothetical protein